MFHQDIYTFHYRLCENGHMIYSKSRPLSDEFCQECGASFVTKCPQCSTLVPSTFQSAAYSTSGHPVDLPSKPGACSKCGKVFPWTLTEATHSVMSDLEAVAAVLRVCKRFHSIVRQLRERHDNRETLDIADEHDLQYLLHALLRVHFDDIREEEWTPSYAGGSARVDFLIKPYMILVEVKKTRKSLTEREIGNQLIEDIARYKQIKDAKTLVCFVHDPEERITNAKGLTTDLEGLDKDIDLKVIISPPGQ